MGRASRKGMNAMQTFLARRWFLLLLGAGLALAAVRPSWLSPAAARVPPRGVVGAALFLMALALDSRSLVRALTRPLPALWAAAVSFGLLPPLAWLAGGLLGVPDYRV